MSVRFSLASAELDPEDLQALTRDFCRVANQQDGLEVELAHARCRSGHQGR